MRFSIALILYSLILFAGHAWAATSQNPAFRKVEFSANYPWSAGFSINLAPDEDKCVARYGARWQNACAATPGKYGDLARGLRLNPPARGRWQWDGSSSLVFYPEDGRSILPDTNYTVDLSELPLPASVILNGKSFSTRTRPRGVRLLSADFFVDPAPKGEHRLTAALEFNFPVDPKGVDVSLLELPGSLVGKPEFVWNQDRDRLNVSWLMRKLPAASSEAGILVPGFEPIYFSGGIPHFESYDPARGGAVFRKNIPGNTGLFSIRKVDLSRDFNESLDRRHVLELETSLYATLDELLANLEVLELPRYNSPEATLEYDWSAAPALSVETLNKSRKIRIEPLDMDKSPRTKFRLALNITSGAYALVTVKKGFSSVNGHALEKYWVDIRRAESGEPDLGFLRTGNILPLTANGLLDIFATDLDEITWEAQLIRDPFMALLAVASSNAFVSPLDEANLNMDAISATSKGILKPAKRDPGKAVFMALDLAAALREINSRENVRHDASGLVRVNLVGKKNGQERAWASRLVLATNLGLMAKRAANGSLDCFVANFGNSQPAAAALVSILGANGKAILSGLADDRGHIAFPSIRDFNRESRPVAAVAELDGNLAWLPLNDRSRELNYSEFATGGAHVSADDLLVHVFSQRGIYRPGDTLRFGCLAKRGDFSQPPADTPLYAEIIDPRGTRVWEASFRGGRNGIADLGWTSPEEAISGRYTFNARTARDGDILGSTSIRLEEFQPDTMKIKIDVPNTRGWVHIDGEAPSMEVSLQNLFGTPAAGHKVRAWLETAPARFNFEGFENFIFTDATPFAGDGNKRTLGQFQTDANGVATIAAPRGAFGVASAKITIAAEGFDAAGGRATGAQASFMASPMSRILGYRTLGAITNPGFIASNQKADVEFIALDPELSRVAWNNLEFSISRRHLVTSLVSDGNGGFRYDDTPVNKTVKKWRRDLGARGAIIALNTSEPGDFVLEVRDEQGLLLASLPYFVAGDRIDPPDARLAGSKMRMRLDREAYNAGDTINIALSLPYDGRGLITLEREGVESFAWFDAKAGDRLVSIPIPANFEGKGYAVVSFARSPSSTMIHMEPHAYAVVPFTANFQKRDMNLKLDTPAAVAPGETMKIAISAMHPGQAVVFVVDEGILQLTAFRNPDPLAALLGDRALDVRTLQVYDLLMPDFSQTRLSAFGGGADGFNFGKRFQNPFKRRNEPPVASWSGLVNVGIEPVVVDFPIPSHYNGKLRIMAVGSAAGSAGATASFATVAAPLVLTPQVPLNVSPGDIFEGALTLANTTQWDMNASLDMISPESLSIIQAPRAQVLIPAGSEIVEPFRIRVLNNPGAAELEFHARGAERDYRRSVSLGIRPASPLRTEVKAGVAESSMALPLARQVYPQMAKSVASISASPLPLANGFARFLDSYPYGCSEQLISRTFAQTLTRAWPQADTGDDAARRRLISATIQAITSRFDGRGVALWPNGEPDLLLTAYAADLLLTLREAGIGFPADLLANICDALAAQCALNDPSLASARASAYAIWVLTREGRVTTQLVENLLRALEQAEIAGWDRDIAAALLAASQKMLHLKAAPPAELAVVADGWFDDYAQLSLYTHLITRYFPDLRSSTLDREFFEATAMALNGNMFATFSASQGMRALMGLGAHGIPDLMQARIFCADPDSRGETSLAANGALLTYTTDRCERHKLEMPVGSRPLFWQIAVTGYDLNPGRDAETHGIEIIREYLDRDGNPVHNIQRGDEILVRLTARSENAAISDCMLADLLPGGFEMIIPASESLRPDIKYLDRREDRMLVFTDLSSRPQVFEYRARAVTPGKFMAPAPVGEAMYDQALYGRGQSGVIEILK